jgi:hypothetical protein
MGVSAAWTACAPSELHGLSTGLSWVESRAMKTTPAFIALLISCPLMACAPLCPKDYTSDPVEFLSGDGSFVATCPEGARYTFTPTTRCSRSATEFAPAP